MDDRFDSDDMPPELRLAAIVTLLSASALRGPTVAKTGALRAHLDAQIGRKHRVLTEGPRLGRTEQFTEVTFDRDMPEGTLMDVTIAGHDGVRLLGQAPQLVSPESP